MLKVTRLTNSTYQKMRPPLIGIQPDPALLAHIPQVRKNNPARKPARAPEASGKTGGSPNPVKPTANGHTPDSGNSLTAPATWRKNTPQPGRSQQPSNGSKSPSPLLPGDRLAPAAGQKNPGKPLPPQASAAPDEKKSFSGHPSNGKKPTETPRGLSQGNAQVEKKTADSSQSTEKGPNPPSIRSSRLAPSPNRNKLFMDRSVPGLRSIPDPARPSKEAGATPRSEAPSEGKDISRKGPGQNGTVKSGKENGSARPTSPLDRRNPLSPPAPTTSERKSSSTPPAPTTPDRKSSSTPPVSTSVDRGRSSTPPAPITPDRKNASTPPAPTNVDRRSSSTPPAPATPDREKSSSINAPKPEERKTSSPSTPPGPWAPRSFSPRFAQTTDQQDTSGQQSASDPGDGRAPQTPPPQEPSQPKVSPSQPVSGVPVRENRPKPHVVQPPVVQPPVAKAAPKPAPRDTAHTRALEQLLARHPDLPAQTAVLGVCDDGLPVLFDLFDPTPGAMAMIGDEREAQLEILRTIINSTAMRNSPRGVQFLILSMQPDTWQQWISERGYDRYCLAITDVSDESVREWTLRMADWTEQRRLGQRSGPPVLMILDTLSFLPKMAYDVRLNFDWLAKEGPPAAIWPLAAISSELALSLGSRMLRGFQSRILGFANDPSAYTQLTNVTEEQAASLRSPGSFAVQVGESWLCFHLPENDEGISKM